MASSASPFGQILTPDFGHRLPPEPTPEPPAQPSAAELPDAVALALARALEAAAVAGQWEIVAQLTALLNSSRAQNQK